LNLSDSKIYLKTSKHDENDLCIFSDLNMTAGVMGAVPRWLGIIDGMAEGADLLAMGQGAAAAAVVAGADGCSATRRCDSFCCNC
jgi:hypothetical protein